MAALLLTPANLQAVKLQLRAAAPHLKSAHASEALAAAFGYGAHASLLADLKASPAAFPPLATVDRTRFKGRLAELGYADWGQDLLGDFVRNDAPDPIWRTFKRPDRDGWDAWFRACRGRNIPYVYRLAARKYCTLGWDCISTDKRYDAHTREAPGDDLGRAMYLRFCERARARPDPGKAMFQGSAFVGTVERLTLEVAADFADDLFKMLYTPMRAAEPRGAP